MKEIPLTQGKVALVDDEDYERVSGYKWHAFHAGRTWYARRGNGGPLMHRMILRLAKSTPSIDHINHNGLDNRRENLRICSQKDNLGNRRKTLSPTSSQYKGVSWFSRSGRWCARIGPNSKSGSFIGYFDDEADAARAYNEAARKRWGEFALLNEVD